jgi:4-hydroxythreonine-4-phosphate dehydrogenase
MIENTLNIAIATGEPAGIGPELVVLALCNTVLHSPIRPRTQFTVLGDEGLLAARAAAIGRAHDWETVVAGGCVAVHHHALSAPCEAGRLDIANGRYPLTLLDTAITGALTGVFDAIVTAPLQKSVINASGNPFTGHTEYLATQTQRTHVVMMLAGRHQRSVDPAHRQEKRSTGSGNKGDTSCDFRVALATTHLPLKDVAAALSVDHLVRSLQILDTDLRRYFGINAPRILVSGLNPHAGEHGYLGHEETEIIAPALEAAQALHIDARGPYPADTLFIPRYLETADCVLVMYHDQGLPVLKYATFGTAVNVTLGLPIVRTSVDHGVALDLAGTGCADEGSLLAAIEMAVQIAQRLAILTG